MGKYSLKNIYQVFKSAQFTSDREKYLLIQLRINHYTPLMQQLKNIKDPFIEVIHDKDELSLVIKQKVWNNQLSKKFTALDQYGPLAMITCEVQEEQVTGFLLMTMSVLSPNNISVYVQGAFTTDHIFVDYKDLEKSIKLLNQFKDA